MGTTYVGHVVVEMEVMIHNGVTGMVELEEVLQCPCPLLVVDFDIMHLDRWDVYCCFTGWSEEPWQTIW